jgi:hypothetical protein
VYVYAQDRKLAVRGLKLTTGAHSHLHRVISGVRYHLVEQFDAVLTVQLADLAVDVFPA